MRAGLIIYGSLDFPSGGFLYDRMLVDSLRRAGDTVDILSLPWDSYARCLAHNADRHIRARVVGWRGDVLLQDELVHPSLFMMNRALRGSRCGALVSIVHHLRTSEATSGVARAFSRKVERAYLRSVDGFVFNSQTTQRAALELSGEELPSVVVQPAGDRFGCSMTQTEVADRSSVVPPLRILFVGNIVPRKGVLTLLEALSLVPTELWRLSIVGSRAADRAYARRVDRFIEAQRLRDSVHLEGSVDDQRLERALRDHHVLAMPSTYEGFGIVYLEAMGYGVIPIGSRAGGAAEIITDEKNGFLVSPGDARALARLVRRLCTDRALLSSCALAALARYSAFPGWHAQMDRIVGFLHSMVQRGRGSHG